MDAPRSAPQPCLRQLRQPPRRPYPCAAWPLSLQIAVAVLLLGAGALLTYKSLVQSLKAGTGTIPAQRIDINTATHAELLLLPGVGESLAQRIVTARSHELFRDIDDLRKVPGIGPATLERLRSRVVVQRHARAMIRSQACR